MPILVLASTSRYRRELLERLRLPFETCKPEVDEAALAGEGPADTAVRLALLKAEAGVEKAENVEKADGATRDLVVIGSDQVADLNGAPLGKPGDHARATAQLQAMRGQVVRFHTALAVLRPATGFRAANLVTVTVRFRSYGDDEIERYLRLEEPYDCAGSAKAEALGVALVEAIHSDDPTALIGLPLIRTCDLLRRAGLDPLAASAAPSGPGS